MEENQSDLTLPDITEAEHLTANEVDQEHENGEQVIQLVIYVFILILCNN